MSQKSYDNSPTLYLIPTPIGNLEDITYRAVSVLKEVEVIFSEDTRVTSQLLKHFEIKKKLISSHNYNEEENYEKLLYYLKDGKDVGLVSDRGTPVISDPGYKLAKAAIQNGFNVVSLPGTTAFVPALTSSGLNPQPFLFYGFLNNKSAKRKKELEQLKEYPFTLIFYEAPHRLTETLNDMLSVLGNRKTSISREISKKFEEVYRDNLDKIIEKVKNAKGEFVIIIDGNYEDKNYNNLSIVEHVNLFIKEGHDVKEAIKLTSKERNIPKSEVYNEYHKVR